MSKLSTDLTEPNIGTLAPAGALICHRSNPHNRDPQHRVPPLDCGHCHAFSSEKLGPESLRTTNPTVR